MAIDADVILSNGGEVRMPPVKVFRVAGAGFVDFDVDAETVVINNLTSSQTIFARLNLDADNTAAASNDNKSVRIEAGRAFTFYAPAGADLSGYKLSIA
jgi:hypothetical protein